MAFEGHVVGGVYGTEGWMAPEIAEDCVQSHLGRPMVLWQNAPVRLHWFLAEGRVGDDDLKFDGLS